MKDPSKTNNNCSIKNNDISTIGGGGQGD